ncbi:MAG: hypothetical protein CO186_12420 [Zetaproteobacteria bacterium CG_4_9_14_3_um_filter_49_83]|nr:MAG: hypothetical protein AUJ56_10055 [Zetaproteobacteria bacterium CG1_02_49_23]PIQ33808.1 MAG: hypothetical protein COW62_04245 [Zetaproteobacteria bacterium CG17_big_fil_post_rev_8_21_14_2_50_50_13]PIY57125.1 MAG: hypothetical protein COZ00_00400 [Zetaproteobacteria bacterium CG_4_10_14_0_8_um_filter_49_80]PJA33968.1 MAG: hypothetical protein CO186_12420 [Zetaproteobacteria bacterium CG_4_9_14_3_um_filter_49_83]
MSFTSRNPDWFQVGQQLTFSLQSKNIALTQALEGNATVVWLQLTDPTNKVAHIGVILDHSILSTHYLN